MKVPFLFFCKSYREDFDRLLILVQSFEKYNCDKLKLVISIPESDFSSFKIPIGKYVTLISDESYAKNHITNEDYLDKKAGYLNQEICKLTFFKKGLTNNYFCLDSDAQFIRPFYFTDFMYNDSVPFTVLVQDKDLAIGRNYRNKFWLPRLASIKRIYKIINLDDRRYRTCHGHQTFNSKVLKSLEEDFMKENSYSFLDLIKIEPYEFTWYNAWFQKSKLIDEITTEPIFKTLHIRREYFFSKIQLLRLSDYANEYVGIVLNSKWKPSTPFFYKDPSFFHYLINNILTMRIWIFEELKFKLSIILIQPLKKIFKR